MPVKTVLAAVDFSETATKAAKYAADFVAPDAELVLLHVIALPAPPPFARHKVPSPDELEAVAREQAGTWMHALASYLSPSRLRTEIRVGKPHEEVARLASEIGADLVVIGPHGDVTHPSRFLGTTADRIARTCPVPVLVATNPPAHAPRQLLVPVDDDVRARALFRWARDFAERCASAIMLLHVWSNAEYGHVASMSYAKAPSDAAAREAIAKELADEATQWLEEIARTGIARGGVRVNVAYGNAGDVVIETAAAIHADMVVIGRHGSSELAPALLGSTVRTVLHGARCPVLVVPTTGRESP